MQAFATVSLLVMGVVTLVLGLRLLAVWRRTRQAPELYFAAAFLCGSLGSAGAQIGQRFFWTEPGALSTGMNGVCFAVLQLGTIMLFVAMWRIFGEGRRAVAWTALAGSALAVTALVIRALDGDFRGAGLETRGMAVHLVARGGCFAWATWLTFAYCLKLRRRLALGLADPVVARQIGLWGSTATAMVLLSTTVAVSVFGYHRNPLELPLATGILVACVLVGSACMWCAFFPPAALRRRWLASGGAAAG